MVERFNWTKILQATIFLLLMHFVDLFSLISTKPITFRKTDHVILVAALKK